MHLREGVDTSGAADEDLSVVLGVDVNKSFGTKHTVLELHRAGQTGLFVHGEEALDSRVLQLGIGDDRQSHGDTDTVVGTEGRSPRFQPISVYIGLNGVFEKIVLYVTVFLGYHVHVGLQDDAFVVFVTRGSRYAHDDVHRLVGYALDTVLLSKRL